MSGTNAPAWFVGVDIGGTFTDLVAVDSVSGRRATAKVLTTGDDPGRGILAALEQARSAHGLEVSDAVTFAHATTLAINTVIQRNGAKVGLLTTDGFSDVLEIAYANRHDMFEIRVRRAEPLVERPLRFDVVERIDAAGEVSKALDPTSLETAIASIESSEVESVAVCFLHSYSNPEHELQARDALAERLPDLPVSLSSEVAPVIREYERTLATAMNAYLAPIVSDYLGTLEATLEASDFGGDPRIMRSDGGWFSAESASRFPVRILESGPAAGAIVGAATARAGNFDKTIAFDMGGTTAKACLIIDGEPLLTDELEVAREARFRKGSGLPIRLPSVELLEIGAGGGSIAGRNALGLVQVGPQSAGSDPGPASYSRGGELPTVTDADLLLGFLDPVGFAGGTIELDPEAARGAFVKHVLTGEEGDVIAAAWGVHDLVNENMSLAVRMACVEQGVDPREVSIVATGGAGPLHATGIMEKLGARRVVCPADVGVASAKGLLIAPQREERTLTDIRTLDSMDPEEIEAKLRAMASALAAGAGWERAEISRTLRMRLKGQGYEVTVELPDSTPTIAQIVASFDREYLHRFGRRPSLDGQIEIVDWNVRFSEDSRVLLTAVDRSEPAVEASADAVTRRGAYWGPRHGRLDTAVHSRSVLRPGATLSGPALVEEPTSTIVVPPGQSATVNEDEAIEIVKIDA